MEKPNTNEGKIILGTTAFDDIIGLLFFSVVVGIASKGIVSYLEIARIAVTATLFLVVSIAVGVKAALFLPRILANMWVRSIFVVSGFIFCLLLAFLAKAVRLATIIVAFSAGFILSSKGEKLRLTELIKPVVDIFAPI